MGMSASQARFLSLTARKTNVEYEGQQINQQRTTLSNESSNYYSQLASMTVPTPPSSADYTKIAYTFEDGIEKNTITTLIAQANGTYLLNYTQETTGETIVGNGNVIVTRKIDASGNKEYMIGATKLYTLEDNTTDRLDSDPYLKTLNTKEKEAALALEKQYQSILDNKYGQQTWYVRYQANGDKSYYPVFYKKEELDNANYSDSTGTSTSGIKSFVYGQDTITRDVRNKYARVEQDTTGRYTSIIMYNTQSDCENNVNGTTYKLTATTESDDAAYNDAMNQYYFDKAQYDKKIQEVNSKIEIIQVQDKNLELKLKQLDTEENAIQTEMEAVKKVISKNVESTFKTFSA